MVRPGVRAHAGVGLPMNTGTMAAKEAGFSVVNDVSKYFAIIPAMFMATYPALGKLNIMHLRTPQSAVLAAVIFNADLLTSSGSGLDSDISPASAEAQVARVTAARGLTVERVRRLVAENTAGRQFGVLGEPRVNVLKLNLALDEAAPVSK